MATVLIWQPPAQFGRYYEADVPTLGQVEVQKAGSADFERLPLNDTATYSLALSAYIASGEGIAA